jgi:hypothetical protein
LLDNSSFDEYYSDSKSNKGRFLKTVMEEYGPNSYALQLCFGIRTGKMETLSAGFEQRRPEVLDQVSTEQNPYICIGLHSIAPPGYKPRQPPDNETGEG